MLFRLSWSHFLGYDFFISYRRDDAENYAAELKRVLEREGFATFLDVDETPAATELNPAIRKGVWRSRVPIIVLTPGVLDSHWVREEFTLFLKRRQNPICLNIESFLGSSAVDGTVLATLRRFSWVNESAVAVSNGTPSAVVLQNIAKTYNKLRVRTIGRLITASLAAVPLTAGVLLVRQIDATHREAAAHAHQKRIAETRMAISVVQSLTRDAMAPNLPTDRRLLLALEAVTRGAALGSTIAGLAENTLRYTVLDTGGLALDTNVVTSDDNVDYRISGNGRWIILTKGKKEQHSVQLMDLECPFPPSTAQTIATARTAPAEPVFVRDDGLMVAINGPALEIWRKNDGKHWYRSETLEHDSRLFIQDGTWVLLRDAIFDLSHSSAPLIHIAHMFGVDEVVGQNGHRLASWNSSFRSEPTFFDVFQTEDQRNSALAEFKKRQTEYHTKITKDKRRYDSHGEVWAFENGHVRLVRQWDHPTVDTVKAYKFSPDGCWLAGWSTGDATPIVYLHGLPCKALSSPVDHELSGGPVTASKHLSLTNFWQDQIAVAFSPDGNMVAAGGLQNLVHVWNMLPNGSLSRPRILTGHAGHLQGQEVTGEIVLAMQFSPNGRWLATGGSDILLWDLKSPDPFRSPKLRLRCPGSVDMLNFDPFGRFLVSGRSPLILWDLSLDDPNLSAMELKPRFWYGSEREMTAYFVNMGRWLLTAGCPNSRVCCPVLWPIRTDDLRTIAAKRASRNFTAAEWAELFPGEQYRETFPSPQRR